MNESEQASTFYASYSSALASVSAYVDYIACLEEVLRHPRDLAVGLARLVADMQKLVPPQRVTSRFYSERARVLLTDLSLVLAAHSSQSLPVGSEPMVSSPSPPTTHGASLSSAATTGVPSPKTSSLRIPRPEVLHPGATVDDFLPGSVTWAKQIYCPLAELLFLLYGAGHDLLPLVMVLMTGPRSNSTDDTSHAANNLEDNPDGCLSAADGLIQATATTSLGYVVRHFHSAAVVGWTYDSWHQAYVPAIPHVALGPRSDAPPVTPAPPTHLVNWAALPYLRYCAHRNPSDYADYLTLTAQGCAPVALDVPRQEQRTYLWPNYEYRVDLQLNPGKLCAPRYPQLPLTQTWWLYSPSHKEELLRAALPVPSQRPHLSNFTQWTNRPFVSPIMSTEERSLGEILDLGRSSFGSVPRDEQAFTSIIRNAIGQQQTIVATQTSRLMQCQVDGSEVLVALRDSLTAARAELEHLFDLQLRHELQPERYDSDSQEDGISYVQYDSRILGAPPIPSTLRTPCTHEFR